MKRLILLRHAKSSWDDPVSRDFDRPLNAKGHRAARTVGRELRRLGLSFDMVVASPAARVAETLEGVEQGYGSTLAPSFDKRIYLASLDALIEVISGTDDAVQVLLLAGHSPGLEQVALFLSGVDDKQLRHLLEEKYPTGAIAEIVLPVNSWHKIEKGKGTLTRFVRPRDLDPELGPEY